MKLIKLIVSITLLFLSFSGVYCQEKIETRNTLRLSAGRFYSAIIELQKFYGGGSYTRKFGKFEIGGQVGMRYATYRMTPVSTVEQVNMIGRTDDFQTRSEEHTSELQSRGHLVCRLLLEKKKDNE